MLLRHKCAFPRIGKYQENNFFNALSLQRKSTSSIQRMGQNYLALLLSFLLLEIQTGKENISTHGPIASVWLAPSIDLG
jgi:hypothetical protein